MSNYESCIFILTQLIGFQKSDNDENITLPDQVEMDTLVQFKNFLQDSIIKSSLNDELSSYETFWSCIHCTYNNPIELNTCKICALPRNVCVNQCQYFINHQNNSGPGVLFV